MLDKKTTPKKEIWRGICYCGHPMVTMGRISRHLKDERYPKQCCPAVKDDGSVCGCGNAVLKKAEHEKHGDSSPDVPKPATTGLRAPEFGSGVHKGFQVGFQAALDGKSADSCRYRSNSKQGTTWKEEWAKGHEAGAVWLREHNAT